MWLSASLLPLAFFHFLEALGGLGIDILPAEETTAHAIIGHGVVLIAFLGFALFLRWFEEKYVAPIYYEAKPRKAKK